MLTYNTHLKDLKLPEYGRNIQRMVDFCKTLEDRDERTACAYSIVETMEMMSPPEGDVEEYRRKLWDHLAIMSDFELDIEWPFPVIRPDSLNNPPQSIALPQGDVEFRHYGNTILRMIDVAAAMEEGPEREALVFLLANHMKKMLIALNPDGVEDERVFKDLYMLSNGNIALYAPEVKLFDFKSLPAPKKKKKK